MGWEATCWAGRGALVLALLPLASAFVLPAPGVSLSSLLQSQSAPGVSLSSLLQSQSAPGVSLSSLLQSQSASRRLEPRGAARGGCRLLHLALRAAASVPMGGGGFQGAASTAASSSDEKRLEAHNEILQGTRVAVAASLSAQEAWAMLPESVASRYTFRSELGRGAFGCVLLAEDKETRESVAVKVVRPQEGEMGIVMREGLAMLRVRSEFVAQLLDMGCASEANIAWFVIELLEGQTLHDILVQRGPLKVKEACRVGLDVLGGLRDVHGAGLLHRDIKPHNILRIRKDGEFRYKLIDLGSATADAVPLFQLPHDVFESVDRRGEGRINAQDVQECLAALILDAPEDRVAALMGKHDLDGDGFIDKGEFSGMMAELSALPYKAYSVSDEQADHLDEVFSSLDHDNNGGLCMHEIERAFQQLFKQPKQEQIRWLMTKYDSDQDGEIDRREFRLMYGELVHLQDEMGMQGSHGYMAPEAYINAPMSPASDVWSLGATLFRLVSGQLPFSVSGVTWGKAMVGDLSVEAPKLKHLVFNMNPLFEELVDRALSKDSARRFASAEEMRQQLEAVYHSIP